MPLIGSIGALNFVSGMIKLFHVFGKLLLYLGMLLMLMTMIQWWWDIWQESTFQGLHTNMVVKGLKIGMILFIISEIFFFLSFFWGFFHSSLSPVIEIGMMWSPIGIKPFNFMQIPFLNTMILLCSGMTITRSHHSMLSSNQSMHNKYINYYYFSNLFYLSTSMWMYWSIILHFSLDLWVFFFYSYSISWYACNYWHISICMLRQMNYHFSKIHHFGFEASAWYWHFVDVWLFLYISIYW